MQRRGLHGGFRHRLLLCLSCVLFVYFVVTFHPKRSNQRVAFQSWGLLQVSSYIGKSFLVTAALCLLWRDQLVIVLILRRASKHLCMWFSALQLKFDWLIYWLISWLDFIRNTSVMVIESPSNSYFDGWVHVQQVITSLSAMQEGQHISHTPHPIHF